MRSGWLLLAVLCCPRGAFAQPTYLVRDINPIDDPSVGSEPSRLTAAGDAVYFFGLDHSGVTGLWRTDGTGNGTHLVVETGAATELAAVGGSVFFGSCQLWKTDGTTVGTVLVKDFRPLQGQLCSPMSELTNVNGTLFFVVDARGRSLWKSDGTTRGTRLVKRVAAWNLLAVGKRLFFYQRSDARGRELWTSDGTPLGTRLVKDICPGSCDGPGATEMASVNDVLFFSATDGIRDQRLWRSDGTWAGTRMVNEANPDAAPFSPSHLVAMGGRVFFSAYDSGGAAFWTSDGTAGGTTVLKRIYVGAASAAPGRVFFIGWEPATGYEPWASDGSEAGTVALGDFCPGGCSSVGYGVFTAVGSTTFFAATSDPYAPPGLWASDGTPSGTTLVKNVAARLEPGAVARGLLFFPGDDGTTGSELWKSDGTDVGTVAVTNRVSNSSCTYGTTAVAGRLFFSECDPRDSAGLWVSDGTFGGTSLVKNFVRGPYVMTDYQGTALFTAWDGFASALWRSDGTGTGTVKLSDVWPESVPPFHFVMAGGEAFFTGRDQVAGAELWKTDGTPTGTTMVKDIAPGLLSSSPQYLTAVNDVLYFSASSWDAVTGEKLGLWRSDGTEGGTKLVKKVVATDLTNVNDTLFFLGFELAPRGWAGSGWQLWKSDGTEAGTIPLKTLSVPRSLVNVNGTLFFVAADVRGTELWKSDGTTAGTVCVKDIVAGPRSSDPSLLTVAAGTLFFMACTELHGCELWRSDGTAAGTVMVRDINPSVGASGLNAPGAHGIQALFPVQNKVFFPADDGASGIELWESDGTETGTRLVEDLAAGPQSSFPHDIARVGSRLFFAANDGVVGDELWAIDLGPQITAWPTTAVEDPCQKALAKVAVTLSSPSTRPVTVKYATSDGTATAGEDYVSVFGTLGFAPGVTSRVIRVPIWGDRVAEPEEYFTVTLSGAVGGVLDETASTAAVWIEDRPLPPFCR